MRISPMPAGGIQNNTNVQAAQDAKARAINALMGGQTEQTPTPNPTNVSPEEIMAITPQIPTQEAAESVQNEDTQPPPKEEETLASQQRAILARREKALRLKTQQLEQQYKQREEALKAKEAELLGKKPDYTGYYSKDTLKLNPLKVLEEAGVSYEDLTQRILAQQSTDPALLSTIDDLKAQIRELKSLNEETNKSMSAREEQSYQAAVNQIKADVNHMVNRDPAFATIKATGSQSDVVELIERVYKEEGVVMDAEEAARQVEDYLIEEAIKLTKLEKIRQRLTPASTPAKPQGQTPTPSSPTQKQPVKTLTNAIAASPKLSARERAILAMKGELKS